MHLGGKLQIQRCSVICERWGNKARAEVALPRDEAAKIYGLSVTLIRLLSGSIHLRSSGSYWAPASSQAAEPPTTQRLPRPQNP